MHAGHPVRVSTLRYEDPVSSVKGLGLRSHPLGPLKKSSSLPIFEPCTSPLRRSLHSSLCAHKRWGGSYRNNLARTHLCRKKLSHVGKQLTAHDRRERASGLLNLLPTSPAENTERGAFETFRGRSLGHSNRPNRCQPPTPLSPILRAVLSPCQCSELPRWSRGWRGKGPHRRSASIGPFSNWPWLCHRAGPKLGAVLQTGLHFSGGQAAGATFKEAERVPALQIDCKGASATWWFRLGVWERAGTAKIAIHLALKRPEFLKYKIYSWRQLPLWLLLCPTSPCKCRFPLFTNKISFVKFKYS